MWLVRLFLCERDAREACAACRRGFVGGWLLGCRNSAKTVFQKSELASCSRSDSGLLKNNADFRQPRISSPPAEAEPDSIPGSGCEVQGGRARVAAREFDLKCEVEWVHGSWMSRQRCAGRRGGKAEFPCGLMGRGWAEELCCRPGSGEIAEELRCRLGSGEIAGSAVLSV